MKNIRIGGRGFGGSILLCLAVLIFNFNAFALTSGDRIQTSGSVNVRQSAGGTAYASGQPSGALGVIIGSSQNAPIGGTGTIYTWWYVDFDSGQDGWVATTGFAAIKPATPTSPSPGTTSSPGPTQASTTVTLSWGASTGTTFYDLGVVDVATGSFVVNTTTTSTSYTATLTAGKTYKWNVAAGDSAGESTFTTVLYFQTPAALLTAPTLSGPADGATSVSTTPTFSWSTVSGANRYWLICSTSLADLPTDPAATSCPNCVTFGLSGNTDQTSYTPPTTFPYSGTTRTLNAGTLYYWKVQGWNTSGTQGNYSSVRTFTTASALLPAPTLSGPADGATSVSTTPTFSWSTVSGANRYWLICSTSLADLPTDPAATSCPNCVTFGLSGNTDQTSYTPPTTFPYSGTTRTLNAGTLYYWKVQGWNTSGAEGNYSSARTFTTAATVTPLGPPTLVSPGNTTSPGSTISTTTPQFQWQAVTGADGYALYISKFNGSTYDLIFDSSTLGGPLTGTSYTLPGGYLLSGGLYRWNMATHNGAGYGSANASRFYFTIAASSAFYLSFPLQYNGWTPYTAQITTVFDHAMTSRYSSGGGVVAYTGEAGTVVNLNEPPVYSGNNVLYSFKKADGSPFVINNHYVGSATTGNATLNYDGHPGYDYPVPVGTDVYAAADGQVITTDANTTTAGNYVRIQHGDSGYQSQYLHLSQILVSTGQTVTRGQQIGKSGNTAGPNATVGAHLHFEVKKGTGSTAIAVDPYGWEGVGADPYTIAANVNLWNPVLPSCTYSTSPSGNVFGSAATSGSFSVATSAGCSWTATTADSWITVTSGSGGSGNGTVNYSLLANTSASARTGTVNVQGQLFTITQAGLSAPIGYPSATWKGPAATGNYETGRGGNSISKIIVHTTEGSAQSALDRFQTSGEIASAHYIVSTAGVVWQVVADADTAYHCGNYSYNQQSIGIELEGWADGNPTGNFSWQTDAQFTALQNLITWLMSQYSIPLDRAHIICHNQVPSPGSPYPPTTEWGGASNHYDNGAWWNWRRLMNALGHAPSYSVLNVQSAASITTLPQSGAPIIAPATAGQRFVAYDSYGGYYLVFVCGSETPQTGLPAGGEFHWDGWIPAANVSVISGPAQLEVTGTFPQRLNVRSSPTTSAGIIAHTIDGKRHVATGSTASADGYTWREFYLTTTGNTVATGWSIADNLTVIGGGGGGAAPPVISSPKLSGTTFTLSVPTQTGTNYILEYKNLMSDAAWTPIKTNSGNGGMMNLTNTGVTGPSRFYRIRIQ